ncbi:shikimate kinase [uncultured Eudoraea sp.]|uniref:shikimate kinase n=1 Tax=uncultured Eudoraea sp. TaxID=1035614 RepID=UPI002622255D|nr:shikimate kinase [uncultured Eudoraea sp.]
MKVVLIGYMGSGKTTVGKLLAEELNLEFVDLDDYIETRLSEKIAHLFATKGELFFRKKESALLNEILDDDRDLVIALGGGTPCYGVNMDTILQKTNLVFYLRLSIASLIERLYKEKDHRPLIAHLKEEDLPEFIGKHLFERGVYYSRANYTVIGDNKDSELVKEEITALLP